MLCPKCQRRHHPDQEPCPECGGCGEVYCCEGAMIDDPVGEEDGGLRDFTGK